MTSSAIARDSVDAFIAEQLPHWMKNASVDRLNALHQALLTQQRAQTQLETLRGAVVSLDAFAEPLLVKAMQEATGELLDVRKCRMLRVWRELDPLVLPVGPLSWIRHESEQGLLVGALHNFAASEEDDTALQSDSRLFDDNGATLALAPGQFIALCRTLDLGGQYQTYLKSHLAPTDPQVARALEKGLEEILRSNFEAQLRLGALSQAIDERTFLQLLPVVSATAIVPAYAVSVRPRQLYLLGKRMIGPVTLEIRRDASSDAPLEGVVAWIPGDPEGALGRHASWAALYAVLGRRMREPGYPAFFARFVSERDRPAFTHALSALLAEPGTVAVVLDGRDLPIEGELLPYLRRAQTDRIIDDARVLAVPTEDEDRATREARLHEYESAGLDLLTLASLFVPGLGLAMLGVSAVQVAREVYEGYQDWQLGDREAALGHVFAVAASVVVGAGTAAATAAVARLAQRVDFVDGLLPVLVDDRLRLCNASLDAYRSREVEAAIGQVQSHVEQHALKLHAGSFKVEPAVGEGEWRIVHPIREGAYSPVLRDNGTGGWHHDLDQPGDWQDERLLLARLGSALADVSDVEARALTQTTGIDADRLRRLHLEGAPAPARLIDALDRHRLHVAEPALDAEAVELRIAGRQQAEEAGPRLLQRDFPNLSRRSAKAIHALASGAQHARMLASSKVPLPLAEQARWALRDARLDRACAGLLQAQAVNTDTRLLMLRMADQLMPWRQEVRVELRDGAADGVVLARQGADEATQVRRIVCTAQGHQAIDAAGQAVVGSTPEDSLAQALLWHMELSQKLQLGVVQPTAKQLTTAVLRRINADREQAASLIGMLAPARGLRPPVRLGDGRLGYPLSGRGQGAVASLTRGMRRLFPTLSEGQIGDYLEQQVSAGLSPWQHLVDLERQLSSLRATLEQWCREGDGLLQRLQRRRLAKYLRRTWRRKSSDAAGNYQLIVDGEVVGELPTLPEHVQFGHLSHLTLRNLKLATLERAFIERFSGLRRLDLSGNTLVTVPEGIEQLTQLTHLNLADNQLVLDVEGNGRLSALTSLQWLDLSGNPVGMVPDLTAARALRTVSLRNTGLSGVPVGLLEHPSLDAIDLRDNRIHVVSEVLIQTHRSRLGRFVLHDNPLSDDSRARLQSLSPYPSRGEHAAFSETARDTWLADLTPAERSRHLALWDRLAAEHGQQALDLFRFFRDLGRSDDYLNQPARMRQRVWAIIEICEQNSEVREAVFQQVAGVRTCSDQLLLLLAALEVRVMVVRSTSGLTGAGAERALLELGRSLFRLDQVDRIAASYVDTLRRMSPIDEVDDVEIYLGFRVGLAKSLGLPEQPEYMNFGNVSHVGRGDLRDARVTVLAQENNNSLSLSLVSRDFWQTYLRENYRERFQAMDAPFHERLEALDPQASTEQVYMAAVDALMVEQRAAELELMRSLTREAYTRFLP
ncbi:NEL-type E3 ubiquitin ligase domain-containing protein [Pseudomonas sp. NPDC089554]|uniref:NEL-type E3 ubiquitin ligase domain-containing protein n=1 Tax=Pseudomonas sp. NPDC089554 TaxID=3390653 RepID=UPI003D070587